MENDNTFGIWFKSARYNNELDECGNPVVEPVKFEPYHIDFWEDTWSLKPQK